MVDLDVVILRELVVAQVAGMDDRMRQSRLTEDAGALARHWNRQSDVTHATREYVLAGLLRHELPELLLRRICDQLREDESPRAGTTLWGWFARQRGEWYGSNDDVRFGDGSPEGGREIRFGGSS